ncbi:MAG: hypothetical protein U0586_01610 [Candidatus Brocadiaceae bacterium]
MDSRGSRETLTNAMQEKESDSDCESLWKKIIGKPYSGKLNVRFDEGVYLISASQQW